MGVIQNHGHLLRFKYLENEMFDGRIHRIIFIYTYLQFFLLT